MLNGTSGERSELEARPDAWLVEQFQKTGDHVYFGILHDRYRRKLLSFLAEKTGNMERAQDIAQETLIKAFTHLPTFVPGNFWLWLRTIAAHTAINEFRRRAVRRGWEEHAIIDGSQPEHQAKIEERLQVLETLDLIPSHMQKACLKLFYMCGYRYHEIAALLDMDASTVRSHISNGKWQFKKLWRTVRA